MTLSGMDSIRALFPTLVNASQYLPLPALQKVKRSAIQLKKHAITSMDRYRSFLKTDPTHLQHSLFAKLFKDIEMEGVVPPPEMNANAQAYIVAGSDTTSNSLTYLVWAVCSHPAVKSKLVAELCTLPDDFEESDLRNLKYLGKVINESMRLYGAAQSSLPRIVPSNSAKLAGYWIPAGTTISVQAYSMHREPSIFHMSDKFDPSRWDSATEEMREAMMPFSRGARGRHGPLFNNTALPYQHMFLGCIGKNLAMIELRLGTAIFFRRFPEAKMSNLEGMSDKDMEPLWYFVLSPKGRRCLVQER